MNRDRLPSSTLVWSVVVALAYVGAGRLGLLVASSPGRVSAVWPAAGVAVAAVLIGGRRLLGGVAAGALVTALSTGEPVLPALLATIADTIEPWVAATLLRRVGFRERLGRTTDVIAYVGLAAILSGMLGAALGATAAWLDGAASVATLPRIWRDWWLGDFSGILILGSAILTFAGVSPRILRSRATVEVVSMTGVVGVASFLLLRGGGSIPYLVLPLLFVLAFAYGQRGATIGAAVVSFVAVALTARGHGPFPGGSMDGELIRAQTFVCVGSVTGLLVAAAQSERRLAEQAVDRLAESESALGEAQRLARIGSFDTDLTIGREVWSAELYRIIGRDPRGCPAAWSTWRSCVHPDDVAEVDRVVDEAYARAGAGSLVHRIIRPDGAVRTIDARFRFESDPGGRVVRVHGTCQDITAIKVAEERFRSLFENAPYPMLVIDPAAGGRVSLSNLRAQEILGVSREELHGRPISDFVAGGENGHEPWYADGGPEGDGELSARRRDGSTFPVEVSLTPLDSEDGGLVSVAIRDVTADRAAAASLSHQARHDALTGLPNRVLFLERLERALARARRSGRPLAVIFLDLDDFKLVNDTRGHEVGDALLMALTPRLNAAVRYGDTIARLGGDEFVALCEDLGGDSDALEIAERLTSAAREPVWAGDLEHHVSISAGIVMVIDPESVTAQAVLRDSDAAMYAAKANGKGRVAMFDESMRERLMERVAIEASLRGAVDRGELELYYQPVVGLDHGRVVAVEALLRWHHPVRGLLGAAEFMPVAERSGLTGAIGEWVIDQACRQAVSWRGAVPVSVNVSAHQLTRSDLPATVARVLKDTGLEPRMLMLEVTEGTLLQDAAEPALRRLKALGVRIVVDDFGTGYSSVAALRGLGVDGLKLDRSFVHALGREGEDGSVVGAILGVAGALDADVMAEGVETWAQATRLRMHGCALAQGYLFARPCPATELSALLASAGRSGHAAPLAL